MLPALRGGNFLERTLKRFRGFVGADLARGIDEAFRLFRIIGTWFWLVGHVDKNIATRGFSARRVDFQHE